MNLKITFECETKDCGHTVQAFPSPDLRSTYVATCGGCEQGYVIRAFEVAETAEPEVAKK